MNEFAKVLIIVLSATVAALLVHRASEAGISPRIVRPVSIGIGTD